MACDTPKFITIVAGLEEALFRDAQEASYQDLLAAHETMARVLIRLCRQLNALTPVGKLPPELLTRVFMLCVHPLKTEPCITC
ncbi:hypothetical protein VTO73DRAFT_8006 [Trametes versicolor]